ncbi:hypothetical protein MOSE0_H08306 [Monosporozyma servazzii]
MLALLTDASVWLCLLYMNMSDNVKDISDIEIVKCLCLGIGMTVVSFLVLFMLGPVAMDPETTQHSIENENEDVDDRIKLVIQHLLPKDDEIKAGPMEEITKLRNDMLEREKEFEKASMEKDKESRERNKKFEKTLMEVTQDLKRLRRERNTK